MLHKPVATRKNDPFYRSYGSLIPHPSNLRNLISLLSDDKVIECLTALVHEITSRKLMVVSVGKDKLAIESAEFIQQQLNDIGTDQGFDEMLYTMSTAKIIGQSFAEIKWAKENGKIVIEEVSPKDPRRLEWHEINGAIIPALHTGVNSYSFLPARRHLITRYWAVPTESPYGYGLGEVIQDAVESRQNAMTNADIAGSRISTPIRVGSYPEGTNAQQIATFEDALDGLDGGSSISMPAGYTINFIQPPIQGGDMLSNQYDKMSEIITLLILGETTAGRSTPGSYASDLVSASIRVRKAASLSKILCNTLRQTLVRWSLDLNYPGAPLPRIYFDFETIDKLVVLTKLKELGYSTTQSFLEEEFGIPLVEQKIEKIDPVSNEQTE